MGDEAVAPVRFRGRFCLNLGSEKGESPELTPPSPRAEPQGRDSVRLFCQKSPGLSSANVSPAGDAWNHFDLPTVLDPPAEQLFFLCRFCDRGNRYCSVGCSDLPGGRAWGPPVARYQAGRMRAGASTPPDRIATDFESAINRK